MSYKIEDYTISGSTLKNIKYDIDDTKSLLKAGNYSKESMEEASKKLEELTNSIKFGTSQYLKDLKKILDETALKIQEKSSEASEDNLDTEEIELGMEKAAKRIEEQEEELGKVETKNKRLMESLFAGFFGLKAPTDPDLKPPKTKKIDLKLNETTVIELPKERKAEFTLFKLPDMVKSFMVYLCGDHDNFHFDNYYPSSEKVMDSGEEKGRAFFGGKIGDDSERRKRHLARQ